MVWCLLKKLIYIVTGRLGLLDYDEVELNNLHRQVLHGEENQGQSKALSAAHAVRRYQLVLDAFIHICKCMYCISMCLNKWMYWVSMCFNSAGWYSFPAVSSLFLQNYSCPLITPWDHKGEPFLFLASFLLSFHTVKYARHSYPLPLFPVSPMSH